MKDDAFERLMSYMDDQEKKGVVNPYPESFHATDFTATLFILEAFHDVGKISDYEYKKAVDLLKYGEKKILLYKIQARRNTKSIKEFVEPLYNLLVHNVKEIDTICILEELDSCPEIAEK